LHSENDERFYVYERRRGMEIVTSVKERKREREREKGRKEGNGREREKK
jgi:hypothetical protein